ncbi:hypothetical protein CSKR_106356 [Clonorchis sinensis]|uniref:Uncharacterized protein n=1 Tax=Clonorchis sinensis TaxID=79923 RepID=A0A419Q272_CLOSI|nr:hypothetical protein CSKR_106356 [Clonorchis sinensis]
MSVFRQNLGCCFENTQRPLVVKTPGAAASQFEGSCAALQLTNPSISACLKTKPNECDKYTHLQTSLVFTRDSSESLVYGVLQLSVLNTGHLMFQLLRYARYRTGTQLNLSSMMFSSS